MQSEHQHISGAKRLFESEVQGSPQKRVKFMDNQGYTSIPAHPQGVQPMGNIYLDDQGMIKSSRLRNGLGIFQILTDDVLLSLLSYFSVEDILKLGKLSRIFYIFCKDEGIWRNIVLNEFNGSFFFHNNWKDTYICTKIKKENKIINYEFQESLSFEGCYSDILYQPWRCSHVDLNQWAKRDNIDRRSNLSLDEFINEYEKPGKPVIITDIVPNWVSFHANDERKWNKEMLLHRFGSVIFKAGAIEMTLNDYWNYMDQTQEETPIYLFDNQFIEKANPLGEEYSIANYFKNDYFSLLDDQPKIRPSYRWILIGPSRSGSTFHKDPNMTSAWNGVIYGRKKWILFPPDFTPPGVLPSCDELDVTTPISVTEWFLNFYGEARKSSVKPFECVQKSGELLFIPHMWWHTALNLEECVAVTQNYVNDQNLLNVLDFLHRNGKKKLYLPLENKIDPEIIKKLKDEREKEIQKNSSTWEKLTFDTDSNSVFKFSFT